MFKVEYAVRQGFTSVTSQLCRWNQACCDKVSQLEVLLAVINHNLHVHVFYLLHTSSSNCWHQLSKTQEAATDAKWRNKITPFKAEERTYKTWEGEFLHRTWEDNALAPLQYSLHSPNKIENLLKHQWCSNFHVYSPRSMIRSTCVQRDLWRRVCEIHGINMIQGLIMINSWFLHGIELLAVRPKDVSSVQAADSGPPSVAV